MEQKPRYESVQLPSPEFWQRHPKQKIEKRQPLQQMLLGELNICMQKTESRSISYTLYRNQLKQIKDLILGLKLWS
jgi:hypothetical protein